jgi:putative DNA methylase
MNPAVTPFSLKDAPALIEHLLPVQKLSADVFKERKAGPGQTLVPLGAYWKGRKPLILNKACILGCLLPATDKPKRDQVLSYGKRAIVDLVPSPSKLRYEMEVRSGVTADDLETVSKGTVRSDGSGQDPYLIHTVDGREYRTKISTLRGDFRSHGTTVNKLRFWEKSDFKPRPEDIFQERLYAIHWMKPKKLGKKFDYKFTGVAESDLEREKVVEEFVAKHLSQWQAKGWVPDMRIEPGDKTDEPIRTRGWTHWHHLFPARHLMLLALLRQNADGETLLRLSRILDYTSKLCRWTTSKAGTSKSGEGGRTGGASDNPANVFYNQALNTFYNYGSGLVFHSSSYSPHGFRQKSPLEIPRCFAGQQAK